LPGRDTFYREVEPLVADTVDLSRTPVLLDIDVHGIELILRTFGPAERDGLVRQLGDHLRTAIETGYTPYHITQGRFTIVLPDCGYASAVAHTQAVSSALRKPLDVGGISCIDIIKIDRHFVKNLWQPWGEAIVGAAAMLGVDLGPGYHIGRPMFRADFERWLAL